MLTLSILQYACHVYLNSITLSLWHKQQV
jgi:hypothetical protein